MFFSLTGNFSYHQMASSVLVEKQFNRKEDETKRLLSQRQLKLNKGISQKTVIPHQNRIKNPQSGNNHIFKRRPAYNLRQKQT